MSSSQITVLDVAKYVKIAREHACLGLYSESLSLMKRCLKTIQE